MKHDGEYTGGGKLSKWSQAFSVMSVELISANEKVDTDYAVD
jgi:hypothetical protein